MRMDLSDLIEIPEGITAERKGTVLAVTGPNGTVEKNVGNPRVVITVESDGVKLISKRATKSEKKMINTYKAHIKNMLKGVGEVHQYKLKICSGHFPMNVSINNSIVTIKNFIGESVPRTLALKPGVDVKLDGQIITVESPDIELAGQAAADIEQLTRITNRDRRIFQDGIFIIKKSRD